MCLILKTSSNHTGVIDKTNSEKHSREQLLADKSQIAYIRTHISFTIIEYITGQLHIIVYSYS